MGPLLIAIMGPTCSGKTSFAESIAAALDARLINADAFQVYKGLDIGTAKPLCREGYALLDIKSPDESFSVGEFVNLAIQELEALHRMKRSAVVVGGTGLYIRALLEEYTDMAPPASPELRSELTALSTQELSDRLTQLDPDVAASLDLKNPARVRRALERTLAPPGPSNKRLPPFTKLKFGLDRNVGDSNRRIEARVSTMIEAGWVQEVGNLRESGYVLADPGLRAIGYRHIWELLEAKIDCHTAIAACIQDTRRYAKRQRTWLRKEPNLIRIEPDMGIDQVLNRIGVG